MIERDFHDYDFVPSLEDFKSHLRITSSDQDALLTCYLKAAIEQSERYIGRIVAKSTFTQIEVVTDNAVELKTPLLKIESVTVEGNPAPEGSYDVKGDKLHFSDEYCGKKVTVQYIAGQEKPEYDIVAAILLTAADIYSNPVDSVRQLPTAASRLLDSHRTWGCDGR